MADEMASAAPQTDADATRLLTIKAQFLRAAEGEPEMLIAVPTDDMRWLLDRLADAREEIATDDKLLADRDRILDALPCPAHGRCVPYVLEMIDAYQDHMATRCGLPPLTPEPPPTLAPPPALGEGGHPRCGGCDGPHLFDTSVPSALWNQVIRTKGLHDYLCAACILRAFAVAGVSFTATLWGTSFDGISIAVTIQGVVSTAAQE